MRRKATRKATLTAAFIGIGIAVLGLTGCRGSAESATGLQGPYPVVSVVDGDTLRVNRDGQEIKVRLIGINTPETVAPDRPVECYGPEASARAKQLASSTKVYLEYDPATGDTDKYGRTLAYVWLTPDTMMNEMMVGEGYAYEYTYDKAYRYQSEFKAAEAKARSADLGLWAACPPRG